MLVQMECPQCGAKLEIDETRERAFCSYCGAELINFTERVEINQNINVSGTVIHKADRSNEPNVIIDFATSDLTVAMIVAFSTSKIKRNLTNGQTAALRLPLGQCKVDFNIGERSYSRTIWVVEEAPVRINASHFGHNEIDIEQPAHPEPKQDQHVESADTPTGLSKTAFILALFGVFPPAIILASIDIAKNKERPHRLSIAALVIAVVYLFVIVFSVILASSGNSRGV